MHVHGHTHIYQCAFPLSHTQRKTHMQRQKKKHTYCRAYTIMTFGESVNMEFLTMATLRSTHEIIPRWHSLQHFPACPILLIWLEGLLQQSLQKQVSRKSRSVCAGSEAREKEVKRGGRISGGQINEGYHSIRVTSVCLSQQRCTWQTDQKQGSLVTWFPFAVWGKLRLLEKERGRSVGWKRRAEETVGTPVSQRLQKSDFVSKTAH